MGGQWRGQYRRGGGGGGGWWTPPRAPRVPRAVEEQIGNGEVVVEPLQQLAMEMKKLPPQRRQDMVAELSPLSQRVVGDIMNRMEATTTALPTESPTTEAAAKPTESLEELAGVLVGIETALPKCKSSQQEKECMDAYTSLAQQIKAKVLASLNGGPMPDGLRRFFPDYQGPTMAPAVPNTYLERLRTIQKAAEQRRFDKTKRKAQRTLLDELMLAVRCGADAADPLCKGKNLDANKIVEAMAKQEQTTEAAEALVNKVSQTINKENEEFQKKIQAVVTKTTSDFQAAMYTKMGDKMKKIANSAAANAKVDAVIALVKKNDPKLSSQVGPAILEAAKASSTDPATINSRSQAMVKVVNDEGKGADTKLKTKMDKMLKKEQGLFYKQLKGKLTDVLGLKKKEEKKKEKKEEKKNKATPKEKKEEKKN